jgi:hypothetical protein
MTTFNDIISGATPPNFRWERDLTKGPQELKNSEVKDRKTQIRKCTLNRILVILLEKLSHFMGV